MYSFRRGRRRRGANGFYRALKIDPTLSDAYRNLKWFLPRPNRDAEQVPLSQYLDEVTRLHEAGKVQTQDRVFSALRDLTIVPPQDMMGHLIARCVANWELCVSWVSQAMPSFYNERAMLEVILKAFRAQRQHAAALAAGQRLTVLVPESASYQFNCALLAQAAGAPRQAVVGFLRRAMELNPKLYDARLMLAQLHKSAVSAWHFPMMNDRPRNEAFDEAIRSVVESGDLVLDIGAGS